MSGFERDNIEEICDLLEKGGVIAYPTDTIWGIGCDALNPAAVERVSQLKQRPANKTMILLVSSIDMLKEYVFTLHPKIETLLAYHERPITVIYDTPIGLPETLLANDGTVAIRVVRDHFCEKLIEAFGKPIISTSANVSGLPFPESFGQISSDILSKVDYVVKHRQADKQKNEPSLLIKMSQKGELVFLRR